jgi:hypothetical protein
VNLLGLDLVAAAAVDANLLAVGEQLDAHAVGLAVAGLKMATFD